MHVITGAQELDTEFNAFLFSPIGKDVNGMTISVLSLLARRDFNPWTQAAILARLPVASVVEELLALITSVAPDLAVPGRQALAVRLAALLPREVKSIARPPDSVLSPAGNSNMIGTVALLMVFLLYVGWVLASRVALPPPEAPANAVVEAASETTTPDLGLRIRVSTQATAPGPTGRLICGICRETTTLDLVQPGTMGSHYPLK